MVYCVATVDYATEAVTKLYASDRRLAPANMPPKMSDEQLSETPPIAERTMRFRRAHVCGSVRSAVLVQAAMLGDACKS